MCCCSLSSKKKVMVRGGKSGSLSAPGYILPLLPVGWDVSAVCDRGTDCAGLILPAGTCPILKKLIKVSMQKDGDTDTSASGSKRRKSIELSVALHNLMTS